MSAEDIFAEWFGPPRAWRVVTEAQGHVDEQGVSFDYEAGRFTITGGEFATPFGTPAGREGILIVEVDPATGQDQGKPVAFREDVLRQAEQQFGTIAGLPVLTGD